MSGYIVPFTKQDFLHHVLQVGGTATCELHRPEQTISATFDVELTEETAVVSAELGGHTGQLTLKRADRANHLHLRDFLQDIANGRLDGGALAPAQA